MISSAVDRLSFPSFDDRRFVKSKAVLGQTTPVEENKVMSSRANKTTETIVCRKILTCGWHPTTIKMNSPWSEFTMSLKYLRKGKQLNFTSLKTGEAINQLPNIMRSSNGPRKHINNPRHAHHNHQLQADTSQGGSVTDTNVCHFSFSKTFSRHFLMRNEKKRSRKERQ